MSLKNLQIDALNAMSLHDIPVKKINFNFENSEINIEILEYCEMKKDYNCILLSFKQIGSMEMSELLYTFNEDPEALEMEIFHHNTSTIEEIYETEFIFLTGFAQPGLKLNFTHKDFAM